MNYDIFNGDADGIIALIQLRLANPLKAELHSGVKRDIALLDTLLGQGKVCSGDKLTVLDISMEKNAQALASLLNMGAEVQYVDHHRSGDIPAHSKLDAHIDLDANTCTSLIVDKLLQGEFHLWAIAAAFGDNLIATANLLCERAQLSQQQAEQLQELGTLINYNGYGVSVEDLHFHPVDLFNRLLIYACPFLVIADKASPFYQLQAAYREDMALALAITARYQSDILKIFQLPNTPWARRISGVYGNLLANKNPELANGVLISNVDNSYTVSLRAPLLNKQGAGDICSQFATGGGRAAAAGINALSTSQVNDFIRVVEIHYGPA